MGATKEVLITDGTGGNPTEEVLATNAVAVEGTKTAGDAPIVQADLSVKWAAGSGSTPIQDLPAATVADLAQLLQVVTDPSRTPVNEKLTIEQVVDLLKTNNWLVEQAVPGAHSPGKVFYADGSLNAYNEFTAFTLQVGEETVVLVENNTGTSIPNGQAVYIKSAATGTPEVAPADAARYQHQHIVGLATTHIDSALGSVGVVTVFGKVRGLDTSTLAEDEEVFLNGTPGMLSDSRPTFPAQAIRMGMVLVSDATDGVVFVSPQLDNYQYEFDGCVFEKADTTVYESGGNIYMDVEKNGGGDLPVQNSGTTYLLDCTTGAGVGGKARVQLTAGTDTAPQENYIIVNVGGGGPPLELQAQTSFPDLTAVSQGAAFVAYTSVWSAAKTATDGALRHQRTTDAVQNNLRGRMAFIGERIRAFGASWLNGANPTATITTNSGVPDNVDFASAGGKIYQMHQQTWPSLSVAVDGIYIMNKNGAEWTKVTDLNAALELADGTAITNGNRYNLMFFGVINKTTGECKLCVNLAVDTYANDTNAYNDSDSTAVVSVPASVNTVAFLLARVPLKYSTVSGGTWEFIGTLLSRPDVIDLRGNPIGVSGSAAGGAAVTFSDALFHVYDNLDVTKELSFQVAGITTGNIRIVTVRDADGTMAFTEDILGSGLNSTKVGDGAAAGEDGIAIGAADADSDYSIAVGANAATAGDYAIAIGHGAQANDDYGIALGQSAEVSKANQLVIGNASSITEVRFGEGSHTVAIASSLDFASGKYLAFDGGQNITSVSTDLTVTSGAANAVTTATAVTTYALPKVSAVNAQTGTTYTLAATDAGKIVTLSNAAAITLTVPAGLGAGFNCVLVNKGAGIVTLTASGTTINNRNAHTALAGEDAMATVAADVANNFYFQGDTA